MAIAVVAVELLTSHSQCCGQEGTQSHLYHLIPVQTDLCLTQEGDLTLQEDTESVMFPTCPEGIVFNQLIDPISFIE